MMQLQERLKTIHDDLLAMFKVVEEIVHDAVDQLQAPDRERTAEIARRDDVVDDFDVRIEQECLDILALQQPVAVDLRQTTTALKVISSLERVADLGVNIAERAASLIDHPGIQVPGELREMASIAMEMLHDALRSYIEGNDELADRVRARDDRVDELNHEVIQQTIRVMHSDAEQIDGLLHLFSASRLIERMADHATHIAEEAIYLVRAEIVRHQHELV